MRNMNSINGLAKAFYAARPVGDFRTTWVSENVKLLTGFGPDRFVREPRFWLSRVHEDDLDYVREALMHLAAEGCASVEYRWRFADDDYHWIRNDAVIMEDWGKRRDTILGSWHRLSRQQARAAAGARGGASIAILRADGTIRYASRHVGRLLRQSSAELVGRRAWDFMHPDDRTRGQRLLTECMRRPGVALMEEVRYAHGGEEWRRLETAATHWADAASPDRVVATLREPPPPGGDDSTADR